MANKFQKSVLERLEQEAARQKKQRKTIMEDKIVADENTFEFTQPIQTTDNAVDQEQLKPESECKPILPEVTQPTVVSEPLLIQDIEKYLIREHQRIAKNKTFYLDGDVIDAVKSVARSQNVTDSKLVNDILRRVLGL